MHFKLAITIFGLITLAGAQYHHGRIEVKPNSSGGVNITNKNNDRQVHLSRKELWESDRQGIFQVRVSLPDVAPKTVQLIDRQGNDRQSDILEHIFYKKLGLIEETQYQNALGNIAKNVEYGEIHPVVLHALQVISNNHEIAQIGLQLFNQAVAVQQQNVHQNLPNQQTTNLLAQQILANQQNSRPYQTQNNLVGQAQQLEQVSNNQHGLQNQAQQNLVNQLQQGLVNQGQQRLVNQGLVNQGQDGLINQGLVNQDQQRLVNQGLVNQGQDGLINQDQQGLVSQVSQNAIQQQLQEALYNQQVQRNLMNQHVTGQAGILQGYPVLGGYFVPVTGTQDDQLVSTLGLETYGQNQYALFPQLSGNYNPYVQNQYNRVANQDYGFGYQGVGYNGYSTQLQGNVPQVQQQYVVADAVPVIY